MSLNIKNEKVHQLAREVARLTGTTQTGAIQRALEEMLVRLHADDEREIRRRRLEAFFADLDRDVVTDEDRAGTKKFMDGMYDENGLPV